MAFSSDILYKYMFDSDGTCVFKECEVTRVNVDVVWFADFVHVENPTPERRIKSIYMPDIGKVITSGRYKTVYLEEANFKKAKQLVEEHYTERISKLQDEMDNLAQRRLDVWSQKEPAKTALIAERLGRGPLSSAVTAVLRETSPHCFRSEGSAS